MRSRNTMFLLLTLPLVGSVFLCGCPPQPSYDEPVVPLNLPTDHGFHFNKNEWVYFSGVLQTEAGEELGFMFTIFQSESPLPWLKAGFVYPSVLIVCAPESAAYHWDAAVGLDGSSHLVDGFPVIDAGHAQIAVTESGAFLAKAAMDHVSLDLRCEPAKAPLLHGEDGLIAMGDGLPSGYYSYTNMATQGTVSVEDTEYTVTSGRTWMDHQWGNWDTTGQKWDWFSLRFDDGRTIMLFQFRDRDDKPLDGNWSYRDSNDGLHYGEDFTVNAKRRFKDEHAGADYPVDWTVTIPSLNAQLEVKPRFDAQNIHTLWEGLCDVQGTMGDSAVSGDAFVELTQYAEAEPPAVYAEVIRVGLKSLWDSFWSAVSK